MRLVSTFVSVATVAFLLVVYPGQSNAYQFWSNAVNDQGQCAACHGKFREGNYFSNAENVFWGDHLHAVHLGNTDVESNPNGSCDSCHGGTGSDGTRKVNLSSSGDAKDGVNAVSCMGCHGRFEDANTLGFFGNGWGAGLRQHHETSTNELAGPGTCVGCHADSNPASFTPAPENVLPPWYASVTNTAIAMAMDPCSADGQEDFSSNGTGTDNDGDHVYDSLDSDCSMLMPTPGDMNADGMADILWRNSSTGQNWLYLMNGPLVDASEGINTVGDTNWEIVGNGDYNGDGNADILWRHALTGQNWMYLMIGATIDSSVGVNTVSDTNWVVAGNGDYDGDGKADILWRNTSTGQNWMYLMNGNLIDTSVGVNSVPTEWDVAGSGDLDGDGKSDILWRNSSTGQNWLYLMNGSLIDTSTGINTISDIDWEIAGNGDYNGDGNADILWRHALTGQNWMYLMIGATIDSSVGVNTISDTNWVVAGNGDYDGDGDSDILWRNTSTGQNWMYLMNGNLIDSGAGVNTVPVEWQAIHTN